MIQKKIPNFYYVYKITNLKTNKCYVGSRICYKETIEEDEYWSSSIYVKKDIEILGKENFKKEILKIYQNKKEMLDGESNFIIEENTLEPNGYNRFIPNKKNGFYNIKGLNTFDIWKNKYDEETYNIKVNELKLKHSKASSGSNNGMFGKHHTKESNEKNRNNQPYLNKHIPDWMKEKIRQGTLGEKNPFYGKKHSEETKEINRQKHLGKKLSTETKEKISQKSKINSLGEKNGMYGKCWVTKNKISIPIIKKELINYLNDGWTKGRIINKKK
jgi:hypothetical protein